jgi:hypothetical protein
MLQVSDLACPKEKDARRHAGADTGAGDAAQCRQGLGAPTERRLSKIAHPHVNLQRLVYHFKPVRACEPWSSADFALPRSGNRQVPHERRAADRHLR